MNDNEEHAKAIFARVTRMLIDTLRDMSKT